VVIDGLKDFPEAISAVYPDCEIMGAGADLVQLTTYPQSPFSGPARCCDVTDLYQTFSQRTSRATMDKSGRRFVVRWIGEGQKAANANPAKSKNLNNFS
jgi:hypothetical protein